MDYYAILGINRDADVADVQKACAHRRALWGSGSRGSGGQIAFNCSRSATGQLTGRAAAAAGTATWR